MSAASYDASIKDALALLNSIVEEAESAGLVVVVRQSTTSHSSDDEIVMNSFEVYQRLL